MQAVVKNVIPALVTLFTAQLVGQASDGSDVKVQVPGDAVAVVSEFAAVAYNGPDGTRPGLVGVTVRSPMGNLSISEDVTINCCLSAATGDDGAVLDMFTRVVGWYDLILTAIMTDPYLAGAVSAPGFAEVGPCEWYPSSIGGSSMTVLFGIHISGAWQQ